MGAYFGLRSLSWFTKCLTWNERISCLNLYPSNYFIQPFLHSYFNVQNLLLKLCFRIKAWLREINIDGALTWLSLKIWSHMLCTWEKHILIMHHTLPSCAKFVVISMPIMRHNSFCMNYVGLGWQSRFSEGIGMKSAGFSRTIKS